MADKSDLDNVVEIVIRLALLSFLTYFCYRILSPFVGLIVWGAILAAAVYPIYLKLVPRLGNKEGMTATLLVLVTLALLITPVYELTASFFSTMQALNARFEAGTLNVPPPNESVQGWPIIGEQLYAAWSGASSNLEAAIMEYRDELSQISQKAVGIFAGLGASVGSFIISTIIAGAFLAYGHECQTYLIKVLERLAESRGQAIAELGTQTVRSVAQGVIGIALIQALAAALGLGIMDVPATGVWVVMILGLAVVQLPPWIVLLPVSVYVFSVNDTVPSVLFFIYAMIVSLSDAVLKPMFLGRGMDIPMPVILLGAIGGVIAMGILGLFIGAIVLAIGYTLFSAWLEGPEATIAVLKDEARNERISTTS